MFLRKRVSATAKNTIRYFVFLTDRYCLTICFITQNRVIFQKSYCANSSRYIFYKHDEYYLLLYFTIETRWKIITVFSVREKK